MSLKKNSYPSISEVTKAIVEYIHTSNRPQFFNYFTNKWTSPTNRKYGKEMKEKKLQGFGGNL